MFVYHVAMNLMAYLFNRMYKQLMYEAEMNSIKSSILKNEQRLRMKGFELEQVNNRLTAFRFFFENLFNAFTKYTIIHMHIFSTEQRKRSSCDVQKSSFPR